MVTTIVIGLLAQPVDPQRSYPGTYYSSNCNYGNYYPPVTPPPMNPNPYPYGYDRSLTYWPYYNRPSSTSYYPYYPYPYDTSSSSSRSYYPSTSSYWPYMYDYYSRSRYYPEPSSHITFGGIRYPTSSYYYPPAGCPQMPYNPYGTSYPPYTPPGTGVNPYSSYYYYLMWRRMMEMNMINDPRPGGDKKKEDAKFAGFGHVRLTSPKDAELICILRENEYKLTDVSNDDS